MNPTPEQIGIFIMVFLTLIPAIDKLRIWFSGGENRRISPQPLMVKEASEYATKDELKELESKFVGGVQQIQTALAEHNKSAERRSSILHNRINRLLLATGTIVGRCQALHGKFPSDPIIEEDKDAV